MAWRGALPVAAQQIRPPSGARGPAAQDKINSFWEISKKDLEDRRADLRNKDREMEEMEERHMVEVKVGGYCGEAQQAVARGGRRQMATPGVSAPATGRCTWGCAAERNSVHWSVGHTAAVPPSPNGNWPSRRQQFEGAWTFADDAPACAPLAPPRPPFVGPGV
jgi:hypothetical protein